ncbi:MAG TPA: S8 family serine peptidase, partial [Gemmatimonadaceae bacterium]|nr:S8 family serine peptidase [Gemmatimonadaceae bacterium]
MSRFTSAGVAVLAVASLVACSEAPVAPSKEMSAPELSLARLSGTSDEEQIVPGEVLVKFKDGIDVAAKTNGKGLGILRKGYADAYVIVGTGRGNENALANVLKNDADVEWAEPNYLRQPDATDARLWAFYNPGGLNMNYTSGGTGPIPSSYASILDADEDSPNGTFAAGGAPVTIGSIDTGVQFNHVEFTGRLIAGQDWLTSDNDPADEDGHGTHTTGTMAGSTVGVAGNTGAASNVKVYVQRVCGPSGCPTSAIINAINAAANYIDANGNHLVAVNFSIGGQSESTGEKTAIQALTNAGVLFVASAGNSGSGKVACPACDVNAISVMATNWKDAKTSYSQYGKGLDIAAPGGECYSNTTPEGCIYSSYLSGSNNGYDWLQGTS